MRLDRFITAACSALVLLAANAVATQVWRCGTDAHPEYSNIPCAQGHEVQADDARSAEQRKAGEDVARRDAALASKLRHEREAEEASIRPANAVSIGPVALAASGPKQPRRRTVRPKPKAAASSPVASN